MKYMTLIASLLLSPYLLHADDIADFVNLGFSEDSSYFMFSQYGASEEGFYADAFIVDVKENTFVDSGVFHHTVQRPPLFDQDGSGAFFTLLGDARSEIDAYHIDHLNTGRLLYISINGNADTIQFRDFQSDTSYTVTLKQTQRVQNTEIESKFHIELRRKVPDEKEVSHLIGNSLLYRKNVGSYRILQIILAPDGHSLVFLIEKEEQNGANSHIRYMVETLYIPSL